MERYEMAELLSRKANVTLAEAREALQAADWDMLDAMVELERRGGMKLTQVEVGRGPSDDGESEPQPVRGARRREPVLTNGFAQIWHYVKRLAQLLAHTDFIILRREKTLLSVPVLVLVILLVCCFWVTLPALVIGLFFGFQYRFAGKRAAAAANRAMEKVESVVDSVKDTLDSDGK